MSALQPPTLKARRAYVITFSGSAARSSLFKQLTSCEMHLIRLSAEACSDTNKNRSVQQPPALTVRRAYAIILSDSAARSSFSVAKQTSTEAVRDVYGKMHK